MIQILVFSKFAVDNKTILYKLYFILARNWLLLVHRINIFETYRPKRNSIRAEYY